MSTPREYNHRRNPNDNRRRLAATAKPTILDKAIGWFDPVKGYRRLQARTAMTMHATAIDRVAGGTKGTMSNWLPKRLGKWQESRQRERIVDRAADLVANDSHAASLVDSITVSSVGTGLMPQSRPAAKILGITEEQSAAFQEQAEWCWKVWSRQATASWDHFSDVQYTVLRSMLSAGEFITLPTMKERSGRDYALSLQIVDPLRLRTPGDFISDPRFRDGIYLDAAGAPQAYWLANPDDGRLSYRMHSDNFCLYPAFSGHRPQVIHRFHRKDPEQVRGVSILAPAMKFFRDLSDYLDFELVGAIVASSFPVFIESANPYDIAQGMQAPGTQETDKTKYQEFTPGQVLYGNVGEKPHILKSDRPGNSFDVFVNTILRAVGAAAGMPYEVVAKDFSKTNYSSARAALMEAWKMFRLYKNWMVNHFCQLIWEMVLEEAWLRGYLQLPPGAPDFYQARLAWCNAEWIGPPRGHIDPLKEMKANIEGVKNEILTLADIAGEQGKDWEAQMAQRRREQAAGATHGQDPPTAPVVAENNGGNNDET